jgi:circadian clock protein KaiB
MSESAQPPLQQPVRTDDAAGEQAHFVFHLYVAGMTSRSMRAVDNISRLCEEHLQGEYDLRVIDIYESPDMAEVGQVVAAPTLVRHLPEPLRRIVGDLTDEGRVLLAFGMRRPE